MNKTPQKPVKKYKTSEIRRMFYKRLLYIGLCLIPLLLLANEKGASRFVLIPFFLCGLIQLVLIVGDSQGIVDDFFPPKVRYEKTVRPFDKFMYHKSPVLFFCGMFFQIFEIRNLEKTIDGTKLFWISAAAGIVLAITATRILKMISPSLYDESRRRYVVHFSVFIGFFLIVPASASFINHFFATQATTCRSYSIVGKSISRGRTTQYFIRLDLNNNQEERFRIWEALYNELSEGGKVELCMVKGRLGFDYVTGFRKTTN